MGDEHLERMDKIEKKQEEIMGQLSKILELMSTDKRKRVAGSFGTPKDVQQTEANTDPVYPPGFTPPPTKNGSIPMPSIGQYLFFSIPLDPIFVPNLDDPKEQEKLKYGSVESKDNPDTHQKFDLLEERLRMIEGMGILTGAAARWYVQLDRNRIHTWKDLARAFVAQYKHVTDMAPDRLSLQNMEKKPTESFKEYAQRWRNVAS
ncbi:Retrotransposon gag domain - like 10 [Theobroma cacao]|nr:Retrotransposon gag domain - like 10 [Theobroma cacao]